MKTDLFQSYGHCWVFQICWHIENSTFTASCFRIWNRLTGLLSPLLALFIVMLPKAYWTSHSRMSGSKWVIKPSWLSASWRSFLYSSPMCSCHLFLVSSCFCYVPTISVLYCAHLCMKCSFDISSFLEEISSLSFLLFSSVSLHCSSKKPFLSLFATLWNSAFSWIYLSLSPLLSLLFFPQLFIKPPQTTTLPSCIYFSLGWFCSLLPV